MERSLLLFLDSVNKKWNSISKKPELKNSLLIPLCAWSVWSVRKKYVKFRRLQEICRRRAITEIVERSGSGNG